MKGSNYRKGGVWYDAQTINEKGIDYDSTTTLSI